MDKSTSCSHSRCSPPGPQGQWPRSWRSLCSHAQRRRGLTWESGPGSSQLLLGPQGLGHPPRCWLSPTHTACPSLWATVQTCGVDPDSRDCQALLSRAGISRRREEGEKGTPTCRAHTGCQGWRQDLCHMLSQSILPTPVCMGRMTLSLR